MSARDLAVEESGPCTHCGGTFARTDFIEVTYKSERGDPFHYFDSRRLTPIEGLIKWEEVAERLSPFLAGEKLEHVRKVLISSGLYALAVPSGKGHL